MLIPDASFCFNIHAPQSPESAYEEGAEARKQGLGKITQSGDTSMYINCGKTARRERVLAHVLYKHMDMKTWSYPLWCVCFHRWNGTYLSHYGSQKGYTTRDGLSQHLKATKVACLWYVPER